MARARTFDFGKGNVGKVLRLPAIAAGDALTWLVPRSPHRWAMGSAFGPVDGAGALLRVVLASERPPRVTWLANSEAEAQACEDLGVRSVARRSVKGWWATARAGCVVLTHGFGDVNRYAIRGAQVIQLWHGTPLKRLHLDSPSVLRLPVVGRIPGASRVMTEAYRRGTKRIAMLPASSPQAAANLASAFGLPLDHVPVLGEPRTDVLFAGSLEARRRAARDRLEHAVGSLGSARVVLYAPTWRDGQVDPGTPSAAEWVAIEDWCLKNGTVVVIRPHPLSKGEWSHSSPRIRLLDPDVEPEVIPVLHGVDALVTDYSSTLVDFAVTGGPIVFFAVDEEAYVRSRGLYRPYGEIAGGAVDRTWAAVLSRLSAVLADGPERDRALEHSRRLAAEFHVHTDGRSAQRVLAAILAAGRATAQGMRSAPVTVFFESFYGRNASCNPRALDAEIARRHPDVERVWSVAAADVPIPPGARAVVQGSHDWSEVRRQADLLVINDWIRDPWRPRPDQFLLQTWHGTPLKRLALARRNRSPREIAAVLKQSSRWSVMLAQSPEASRSLRRAYAVPPRRTWTLGYPRNDAIANGRGPSDMDAVLGVRTPKVVLYAPTWRDGQLGAEVPLEPSELAAGLGPEWTVLVRGHARTMAERAPSGGERVIDVTTYPDVSDLLARADILVTDYSSVMFDFSAGGRPMVFYVPDLEAYTGTRGLLWTLADRAPGPLVRTTAEAVRAVITAAEDAPHWAERYAAWRDDFNPLDDGRAAERVVKRLEERGVLPDPS